MGVLTIKQELLINEQIRLNEVQVISDSGEKLGSMSSKEAIEIASRKRFRFGISFSKCNSTSL